METNSALIRVGRLLEIRAAAGYRSAADVDALFDVIEVQLNKLPRSRQIVTVVDWRRCPVMEAKAAERMLERIVAINPRTERSAALATAKAPVAILQFMRLIRESKLPDRKMFLNLPELIAWVDEILEPEEQRSLREFLAA
jgi:hypothetical protein